MNKNPFPVSSNPMPEGPRKFQTQRTIVMPRALDQLHKTEIAEALERHFRCEWGDPDSMTAEDSARMDARFSAGEEVISAFEAPRPGPCPFYLVTNAERTQTRIELEWDDTPEEQERTRLFLVDLDALLKKHRLTLRPCKDCGSNSPGWFLEGPGLRFDLYLSHVADWLNAEEPEPDR